MRVAVVTGAIAAAIAIGAAAGNGTAPVASLQPPSLSFGSRDISAGATAPQAATVGNAAGTATLTLSAAITGTDAGDFALTNPCGTAIGAGSSCAMSVRFDPTTAGVKAATLTVTDNAPGSPHTSTLSGTGTSSGGGSVTQTAANLWVDTNGGSCARQTSAGAYVDAQACSSMQAAMTNAQGGDQVVVKCGTYAGQTLSSGTKASAITFYAENYDQAVTAYDVLASATCVFVSSLAVDGADRVHIYGIQATKGPWSGARADGAVLDYQSGGSLNICTSNCDGFTTQDILIDGFHGRSAFTRVANVVIDHSAFGGYDVCFTAGQVHASASQAAGQEDAFRFWDGVGGSSTPQNSTIRNSVLHDLIMAVNNAEEGNQCTWGSATGPHSDCMQNNGGNNITLDGNIFINCSSSDIQWNPFSGATVGTQLIQNNVFGPLTGQFVNSTVLGAQKCAGATCVDCSGITVRNNLYWATQAINPGQTNASGCFAGQSIQIYGNVFRQAGCDSTGVNFQKNVFLSGSCGATPKTCTPTWLSGTPTLGETWDGTTDDFNVANSDTCTLGYAFTLFPPTDILGHSRPLGAAADAGANEIP